MCRRWLPQSPVLNASRCAVKQWGTLALGALCFTVLLPVKVPLQARALSPFRSPFFPFSSLPSLPPLLHRPAARQSAAAGKSPLAFSPFPSLSPRFPPLLHRPAAHQSAASVEARDPAPSHFLSPFPFSLFPQLLERLLRLSSHSAATTPDPSPGVQTQPQAQGGQSPSQGGQSQGQSPSQGQGQGTGGPAGAATAGHGGGGDGCCGGCCCGGGGGGCAAGTARLLNRVVRLADRGTYAMAAFRGAGFAVAAADVSSLGRGRRAEGQGIILLLFFILLSFSHTTFFPYCILLLLPPAAFS